MLSSLPVDTAVKKSGNVDTDGDLDDESTLKVHSHRAVLNFDTLY